MTGSEVKKLTSEEIGVELNKLRERLFTLRGQKTTEKVENTSQFGAIRKDIARLLTEQNARIHGQHAEPAPGKAAPGRRKKAGGSRSARKGGKSGSGKGKSAGKTTSRRPSKGSGKPAGGKTVARRSARAKSK